MVMVVIKLSLLSCSEVHLLGSSPNHSCLKLSFFKNFKGDIVMGLLILINLLWLGVGLYTYLTLENT